MDALGAHAECAVRPPAPAARWRAAWQGARSTIAQLGGAWAGLYAVHVALRAVTGGRARIVPYLLYAQPIGADVYRGVRDDPATRIERVDPNDEIVRDFPRPAAVLAQRFAAGAHCHVARVRGRFGAYLWIDRRDHDEDEVRCRYRLPSDGRSTWDFDVYVEPDFRVGRTLARLWKAADATLAREGVRWSFSRISAFNRVSIATHERLGARRVGRAVFVVAGGLQLAVLDSAPYLHLSVGGQAGPVLRLRAPPS